MTNTNTTDVNFIPSSSGDGFDFWLNKSTFGYAIDFPTYQEAEEYGAFQLNPEEEAYALSKHKEGGWDGTFPTTYLLNSVPNAIWGSTTLKVKTINVLQVQHNLKYNFQMVSAIGHQSFADILTSVLEMEVKENRIEVSPNWEAGDKVISALITPPRRLAEGEKWTEEELLSMPIKWVVIYKD